MDYSSLIHDLVDGNLEASQEDNLFFAMAYNEELRSELKSFIAFESVAKNETEVFTPSPESTAAIFTNLGINVNPSSAPNTGISHITKFTSWVSKYSSVIISGASSALVAGLVVFFLMKPGLINNNNSGKHVPDYSTKMNNIPAAVVESDTTNKNIPIIKSNAADNKPIIIEKIRYITKYLEKIEEEAKQTPTEDKMTLLPLELSAKINSFSSIDKNLKLGGKELSSRLNMQYIPININHNNSGNYNIESHTNLGLSFEFMGSENWMLRNTSLNPSSDPKFSNTSITALYSLTDNFLIGLDLRQEFFYQEFNDMEDTTLFRYKQNSNIRSAGIAVRYYLFDYHDLMPFVQGIASLTESGVAGRGRLGIEYRLKDNFAFQLGLEGSYLYYQSKYINNNYNSKKLSLIYGIALKF